MSDAESARSPTPKAGLRLRLLIGSLGAGLLLYGFGTLLELRPAGADSSTLALLARLCGVVGPISILVWQSMVVSGRWRWLTALSMAGALFGLGRWLQGLYGLDPPYIYLVLGLVLQVEALALGAAVAAWFVAIAVFAALGNRRR